MRRKSCGKGSAGYRVSIALPKLNRANILADHLEDRPRSMFMVGDFTIYCNESYTHPPDPLVYTVGGCLSTDVQWKRFRKEWRRILDAEDIACFHMVDFQTHRQPYASWSKEKRAKFLESLHAVIRERTLMSFATTVDVEQ